ncbi:ribonuclease R family protein [Spirochaetota bacterium]
MKRSPDTASLIQAILDFIRKKNRVYFYEIYEHLNIGMKKEKKLTDASRSPSGCRTLAEGTERKKGEIKRLMKFLIKKKMIRRKSKAFYLSRTHRKDMDRLIKSVAAVPGKSDVFIDPEKPEKDIIYILQKYRYDRSFPTDVNNAVKGFNERMIEKEANDRTDLRKMTTVTIDGDDAKDFDDAISIEFNDNIYTLGVHIADVSFFVKSGSAGDAESEKRGTSVYLIDTVVPMLPEKLSNDLCSLKEGRDRLTFSCFMDISLHGDLKKYRFEKTVIQNTKRLTYKKVQSILDKKRGGKDAVGLLLVTAAELAEILYKKRIEMGAIDFESDEKEIMLKKDGSVASVIKKDRLFSERIIEEFMLMANKCAADVLASHRTGIFRVHGHPDEKKIENFERIAKEKGYGIKKHKTRNTYQHLLERITDKAEHEVLSYLLLISMQQAEYSIHNIGHYGLGFRKYTHFTSPIRRYPDLEVHRGLKEILFGTALKSRKKRGGLKKLDLIAKKSSIAERKAVDAEREYNKIKSVRFMRGMLGEVFEAAVVGVLRRGIFVRCIENGIEGFVVKYDFEKRLYFNEKSNTFTDGRNRHVFEIGSKLKVRLASVNIEKMMIDFTPV